MVQGHFCSWPIESFIVNLHPQNLYSFNIYYLNRCIANFCSPASGSNGIRARRFKWAFDTHKIMPVLYLHLYCTNELEMLNKFIKSVLVPGCQT